MYCSDYDGTQLSSRWVTGCRTDPPAHGCMEVHLLEIFQRKKNRKAKFLAEIGPAPVRHVT